VCYRKNNQFTKPLADQEVPEKITQNCVVGKLGKKTKWFPEDQEIKTGDQTTMAKTVVFGDGKSAPLNKYVYSIQILFTIAFFFSLKHVYVLYNTVNSFYLKLGYLEFCETGSVYLNQNYILIAFSNRNLALETFLQVQITRSAN